MKCPHSNSYCESCENEDKKLKESLSKKLIFFRKKSGLKQSQVAELLNIETDSYSRLERGLHLPSLITLNRISKIFLVSPEYLLNEKDYDSDYDFQLIISFISKLDRLDKECLFKIISIFILNISQKKTEHKS
jgi:transcriptional regulator with XRE-family HTH domain